MPALDQCFSLFQLVEHFADHGNLECIAILAEKMLVFKMGPLKVFCGTFVRLVRGQHLGRAYLDHRLLTEVTWKI